MNLGAIIGRMERFPRGLEVLLAGLPDVDARFRPPSGAWSVLDIVNHLADEESDDFRTRLRLTLVDPAREWPSIDPEAWARERKYNERELGESLARFGAARAESIVWLRSLKEPDLEPLSPGPAGRSTQGGRSDGLLGGARCAPPATDRQAAARTGGPGRRRGRHLLRRGVVATPARALPC